MQGKGKLPSLQQQNQKTFPHQFVKMNKKCMHRAVHTFLFVANYGFI